MAKTLLRDYKIGGDVIDRVSQEAPERRARTTASVVPETLSDKPLPAVSAPDRLLAPEPPAAGSAAAEVLSLELVPEADLSALERKASLSINRDGLFTVCIVDAIEYRLGGLKPVFVTSLRANVRVSAHGTSYYDSLDFYSARARSGFALAVQRSLEVESSRVERDLIMILEALEHERDKALHASSARPAIQLSNEERSAGMDLLTDPALCQRIIDDLSSLGYVGEDLNKLLLYLCASSRKLDDPISVLILSQSASGKSFLVDCVRKLMPSEDVVAVTSLSDQALNYIEDLSHKFLVLGEAVHGAVVEHQIREMLSGKELSRLVTIKDPETGGMQSRIVRTPVIVASVMSGTSHAVNPENSSRCFVVNTDESVEQTERIHAFQRQKYSLQRLRSGKETVAGIIKAHHAAQRLLCKRTIVNDFAGLLSFPATFMRTRRDHDRFLDLIACVCFLRQYQKAECREGSLCFIRCDLEDYRVAYHIMVDGVMGSTLRELPKGAVTLHEQIRAHVRNLAKAQELAPPDISFTQRQVRELSGLSHTWVKYALRLLVDHEYLTLVRGGGERSRAFYRLKDDAGIANVDLSMIPTPEAMATQVGGRNLEQLGNWAPTGQ